MPLGTSQWNETRRKGLRIKDFEGKYGSDPFSRPLPENVRAVEVFEGKAGWFGGKRKKKHRPAGAVLMAANRTPEAMVKFISWGSGRQSAVAQLDYISREGTLDVEMDDGSLLIGKEDIRDLVSEWDADFHQRKGSKARNTVHFIVSAPPGSDRDAVQKAAREWAEEVFQGNHAYGTVRHDDTDHPHVHIVAKVRGRDRSRFTFDRDDLHRFREVFAERGRAHGVDMTATPREWRGAARGESMALRQMRDDGRKPIIDTLAERLVIVEKDQPANSNRERASAARRAQLQAEAREHRAMGDAFQMAATIAGDDGTAYAGQAAILYDLAKYLEQGGETTRPERARGISERRRTKTMSNKSGQDLEANAGLAYKEVREAEEVAERMVTKLPEGKEREAAVLAVQNISRAREALEPERENTPLAPAPQRESAIGPDPEKEPRALSRDGKKAPEPTSAPSAKVEREKLERERGEKDRDDGRDRD